MAISPISPCRLKINLTLHKKIARYFNYILYIWHKDINHNFKEEFNNGY